VAGMGVRLGAYRDLVGRTAGMSPLGRPRRRWEENITVNVQEVGWGAWTGMIWSRTRTGGRLL